ncbi:MAG TPA: helix-turn-helix domain-containing protein [Solirubrobacteraceae bacterium]|nr:helix-turn-helix domain-containing protein [Solirubrobacteraceae bacterium]
MEPVYVPVAAVIRAGPLEIRRVESLVIAAGTMRPGDRSVDVYVHTLRIKLEEALPDWRFVHTHVGFGYRFSSEP